MTTDARARRAADIDRLVRTDDDLAGVVAAHGPPPPWERPPAFRTLVLQILEQQLSLDAAAAHYRRLETTAGEVAPDALLVLSDEEFRRAGVSRQKTRYLRELSERLRDGRLDLAAVAAADDDEAARMLREVPGIGPWTADVYLLFALHRRDRFPTGDRALQVGAAEVLGLDGVPTPAELADIAVRWKPRRSAAAVLVWHAYLARRNRTM